MLTPDEVKAARDYAEKSAVPIQEPENPWTGRIMRLSDRDAADLCASFGVSPRDTKYLTAKATVERVSSWDTFPEVKELFIMRLEAYEKKTKTTPPAESSVRVKIIEGNSLSEILGYLFGMAAPQKKRVRVEYETETIISPERMKQVIEEQSKITGCLVFNVSVTEVK